MVGKVKAEQILKQMQKEDVTKDVVKYFDHEAWKELGVKSGIQRSKIMEAVSNMSIGAVSQQRDGAGTAK